MSEAIISRRGLKQKNWDQLTYITASGTFTAPYTGKYRVACVASGGNGFSTSNGTNQVTARGSGGGGIAEAIVSLTAGQQIAVTIDFSVTSFGNFITAEAGQTATSSGAGLGGSGVATGTGTKIYKGTDGSSFSYPSNCVDLPNGLKGGYINGNASASHRLGGTLSNYVYETSFNGTYANTTAGSSRTNPPSDFSPRKYYPSGYVVCAQQYGNPSGKEYASGVVYIDTQEQ